MTTSHLVLNTWYMVLNRHSMIHARLLDLTVLTDLFLSKGSLSSTVAHTKLFARLRHMGQSLSFSIVTKSNDLHKTSCKHRTK